MVPGRPPPAPAAPVIPADPGGATAAPAPRGMTRPPAATPASPGTGVAAAGPPADGGGRRAVRRAWGSLEQLLLNVVLLIVVGAEGLSTQRLIWRRLRPGPSDLPNQLKT